MPNLDAILPGRRRNRRALGLVLLIALVPPMALWALTVGSSQIAPGMWFDALMHPDGSREHIVLLDIRLPRMLAGLLVGAQLAVAGAIMQAVTANPLASPGLLGINAGAAFAVVLALAFTSIDASGSLVWFAFGGAGVAGGCVYALGSIGRGGATPLKLALAGAVLTAFLTSVTTSLLLLDQGTLDNLRLWAAGSLMGRSLATVAELAPYGLAGLACALAAARPIMTLSLGGDVASTVGQNVVRWRLLAGLLVVVLAGSAVALAGPVGFVGLVVPHAARMLVGADYRWIMAYSAPLGALLVLVADAGIRWLVGIDLPVGITMALLGSPVFIALARRRSGMMR
ncbi:iron complex transport system permease protein [Ancylobacter aquaticus]|uniref:Iron complex transport system permease protein n=1 Tax=Ancylobacter aquaticus TaxID=100 RepID=A0A4R1IEE9_ANCAQ|nr:iron ABC transporter permease [Ancylobacter aquaticus]TCK29222.1 iron complex transport system permease protein [Ancylobacter aquaticus]